MPRVLRRGAARHPDADAVRFEDEIRTFADLDHRASRLAAVLQERGVVPGDRVAVWLFNGPPLVESIFATLSLVPLLFLSWNNLRVRCTPTCLTTA